MAHIHEEKNTAKKNVNRFYTQKPYVTYISEIIKRQKTVLSREREFEENILSKSVIK